MQRLHLDLGDDGDRLLSLTSRSALIGGRRSVISDRLVGEHRLVIRPARENSSSLSRRSRTRTRTLRARIRVPRASLLGTLILLGRRGLEESINTRRIGFGVRATRCVAIVIVPVAGDR